MWDPYMDFENATLPNGLKVYASHWPKMPCESLKIIVHAGAERDPVGREGLAHFLEHMVFGNMDISYMEMKEFFEEIGGDENASTGFFDTSFKYFFPIDDEEIALKVFSLASKLLNKAKIENSIEGERSVILSEYERRFPSKFWRKIFHEDVSRLFAGSTRERMVSSLGLLSGIKKISYEDLQSFYDKYYVPRNMSIVGVGGLSLTKLVENLLNVGFAEERIGKKIESLPLLKEVNVPESIISDVKMPDKRDTSEFANCTVLPGTLNFLAVDLVRKMLGKYFYEKLREEHKLVYSFSVYCENYRSVYSIEMNCSGVQPDKLDEVKWRVDEGIKEVVESRDLLAWAKQNKISRFNTFSRDVNSRGVCSAVAHDLIYHNKILSLQEEKERIMNVSWEEIQDVFRYLISDDPQYRWTLLARP